MLNVVVNAVVVVRFVDLLVVVLVLNVVVTLYEVCVIRLVDALVLYVVALVVLKEVLNVVVVLGTTTSFLY